MPKLSKLLWLLVPATLVVTAWCLTSGLRDNPAGPGTGPNSDFLLVACALLVAMAISLAGLAHSRWWHTGPGSLHRRTDLVRVLQSLRLSPREAIHVIEFRSKLILIGSSDGGLVRLDTAFDSLDLDDETPEPEFSADGVDLADTPPEPEGRRKLSRLGENVSRSALNAASLAEFRSKLAQVRAEA